MKESDRIARWPRGCGHGRAVEEFRDGLRVEGRPPEAARREIDPQGDHRIAMALAVAALGAEGDTTIRDAECVGVSFPEFFDTLDKLRGAEKVLARAEKIKTKTTNHKEHRGHRRAQKKSKTERDKSKAETQRMAEESAVELINAGEASTLTWITTRSVSGS